MQSLNRVFRQEQCIDGIDSRVQVLELGVSVVTKETVQLLVNEVADSVRFELAQLK